MSGNNTDPVSDFEDNQYCLISSKDHLYVVEQSDVIFDQTTGLKAGDAVNFTYGRSDYEGNILHLGADYDTLVSKSKFFQRENQRGKPTRDSSFHAGKPRKAALQQKAKMKEILPPSKPNKLSSDSKKGTSKSNKVISLKKNLESKQSLAVIAMENMIDEPSTSTGEIVDSESVISNDAMLSNTSNKVKKTGKISPAEKDSNSSDSKFDDSSEESSSASSSLYSVRDNSESSSGSEDGKSSKSQSKKKVNTKLAGKHEDLVNLKNLIEDSNNHAKIKGTDKITLSGLDEPAMKRKKLDDSGDMKAVGSVSTHLKMKSHKPMKVKEAKCLNGGNPTNFEISKSKMKPNKTQDQLVFEHKIYESEGTKNKNSHENFGLDNEAVPIATLAELLKTKKDKDRKPKKNKEEKSEECSKANKV